MQPPLPNNPDAEHIKLLAIFHYVFAGLALLGLGFLCLHFLVVNTVFMSPTMWNHSRSGPPPAEIFVFLKIFYVFIGLAVTAVGVLNFLAARFLRQKRNRTFCLVVAGINCMQIPFGTILGVITIVVLCRASVKEMFGET